MARQVTEQKTTENAFSYGTETPACGWTYFACLKVEELLLPSPPKAIKDNHAMADATRPLTNTQCGLAYMKCELLAQGFSSPSGKTAKSSKTADSTEGDMMEPPPPSETKKQTSKRNVPKRRTRRKPDPAQRRRRATSKGGRKDRQRSNPPSIKKDHSRRGRNAKGRTTPQDQNPINPWGEVKINSYDTK